MSLRQSAAALLAASLALAGCGSGDGGAPAGTAAVEADVQAPSRIDDWALPTMLPGSASPGLATTPGGELLLSWINSQPGRRHILQFSRYSPQMSRWLQAPATIAVGSSMFVNWADVPHMAATPDGALWVHWLQKNGDAPYAYDVVLTRSRDGGANWAEPVRPHDDHTRTEHGFVSMWAQGNSSLGIAWLDGRNTGAHGAAHDGPGASSGAMSLRAAVFDGALESSVEVEIDARVCECCQTGVAATAEGALLVYRGRSADEIRDIFATRFNGIAWSTPVRVHADDWTMPACPVNGPAVAALENDVVVGWFTMDGEEPLLRIAHSADAGASFADAVELDRGAAVQGRVAVAMDVRQAWILWLREEAGSQSLWLSRRSPDLATEYERIAVSAVHGSGRATGFPQLALLGGTAYVAWTDVVDGSPRLRGKRIVRD